MDDVTSAGLAAPAISQLPDYRSTRNGRATNRERPMAAPKFIAYYRVSTARQGKSGLGLDAQREAVERHVKAHTGGRILGEYREIETGKNNDRPELRKAIEHARLTNSRLLIAKLDRLARNVAFISNLMESSIDFEACDFPQANRLTIHVLAAVAEHEARMISERTKAALAVARKRLAKEGKRLGNPNGAAPLRKARKGNKAAVTTLKADADQRAADLRSVIEDIERSGITTHKGIAEELNARDIETPRGGEWYATSVKRLKERLAK